MATRQRVAYQFPVRLRRLATAEVAERPSGVAKHAQLVVFAQKLEQRPQGALLENIVSALWAISCNVAESPDSLLAHIEDGGGEEIDEFGNGLSVDDDLSVFRGARRDVGQSPRGFKLKNLKPSQNRGYRMMG